MTGFREVPSRKLCRSTSPPHIEVLRRAWEDTLKHCKEVALQLLRDESGQNMVEYALVVALIALAAIVGMQGVATSLSTAFSKISSHLNASIT
jgi:pilus assembly protein Flp/PilA